MYVLSSNVVLATYSSGTHFTEHLKPKIFVSSKQIGTYKNLRLKMFSEKGTWFVSDLLL